MNFQWMVDHAMVDKEDLDLFAIVDSAEEAWAALLDRGLVLPE